MGLTANAVAVVGKAAAATGRVAERSAPATAPTGPPGQSALREGFCLRLLLEQPERLYAANRLLRELQDDNALLADVLAPLKAEDFTRPDYQAVFQVLARALDQHEDEPIDYFYAHLSPELRAVVDELRVTSLEEFEQALTLYRANGNMRAVQLPAGHQVVRMKYSPGSVKFGLYISFMCGIVMILALGLRDLVLVGHSFGGGVSLQVAADLCETDLGRLRGLVLVDSAALPQRLPYFLYLLRPRGLAEAPVDVHAAPDGAVELDPEQMWASVVGAAEHALKTGRLEAFSDGVMAIIITIMVLGHRPDRHDRQHAQAQPGGQGHLSLIHISEPTRPY